MELRLGNEKSAADAGDWNSSKKNDARKKRTNGAAEKKKGGRTYFPSAAANKSQFLSRSMSEAAQGGGRLHCLEPKKILEHWTTDNVHKSDARIDSAELGPN